MRTALSLENAFVMLDGQVKTARNALLSKSVPAHAICQRVVFVPRLAKKVKEFVG